MKYHEFAFFTKESKFNNIREVLMKDLGLVPPINDPFKRDEKRKLVWEDQQKIGRYRVDFLTNPDMIYFRYWDATRMTPEIEKTDPMYEAIKKTHEILKPVQCAVVSGGVILEEVLGTP